MKVIIHKDFHPWYYLFFLQGLVENGISFKFDQLIDPEMEARLHEKGFGKDYLILSVATGGKEKIIVIGADDKTRVAEELVEVADIYAKTNVSAQTQSEYGIVPIGPTFGLRYLNADLVKLAAKDLVTRDYDKWRLVAKRASLKTYLKLRSNEGDLRKIFYLNYPWKKHQELTRFRTSIIHSLQALDRKDLIDFEGGFSKRRLGYHEGLRNESADRLYSHKDYLSSLATTKIALNTPAVHSCLGWKMGEFLCLGRCMLSFPIPNVMPYAFQEGVHFHKIEDISQLEGTLKELMANQPYVETIQSNARKYFDNYIQPVKIMQRLLDYVK